MRQKRETMIKHVFRSKSFIILSVLATIFMQSCLSDDTEYKTEEEKIKEYIEDNGLDAIRDTTGIYYIINEEGTGDSPLSTSTVTVRYKGYYLNGNVFDSNLTEEGFTANLQNLIYGWSICLPKLKPGGKGTFIIPSLLAYNNGHIMIFDIELLSSKLPDNP